MQKTFNPQNVQVFNDYIATEDSPTEAARRLVQLELDNRLLREINLLMQSKVINYFEKVKGNFFIIRNNLN